MRKFNELSVDEQLSYFVPAFLNLSKKMSALLNGAAAENAAVNPVVSSDFVLAPVDITPEFFKKNKMAKATVFILKLIAEEFLSGGGVFYPAVKQWAVISASINVERAIKTKIPKQDLTNFCKIFGKDSEILKASLDGVSGTALVLRTLNFIYERPQTSWQTYFQRFVYVCALAANTFSAVLTYLLGKTGQTLAAICQNFGKAVNDDLSAVYGIINATQTVVASNYLA